MCTALQKKVADVAVELSSGNVPRDWVRRLRRYFPNRQLIREPYHVEGLLNKKGNETKDIIAPLNLLHLLCLLSLKELF